MIPYDTSDTLRQSTFRLRHATRGSYRECFVAETYDTCDSLRQIERQETYPDRQADTGLCWPGVVCRPDLGRRTVGGRNRKGPKTRPLTYPQSPKKRRLTATRLDSKSIMPQAIATSTLIRSGCVGVR